MYKRQVRIGGDCIVIDSDCHSLNYVHRRGAVSDMLNTKSKQITIEDDAVSYTHLWNQIFSYRNDGEYSIDNMTAERAIRPITVQRKNSLFFGKMCIRDSLLLTQF